MTEEEKAEILQRSFETLDRLQRRAEQTNERDTSIVGTLRGHFDPVKRNPNWRDEPEPEVRHSAPIITKSMQSEPDFWAAIDARIAAAVLAERNTICAIMAEGLGGALKDLERSQSTVLSAELGALKIEINKLHAWLEALRSASEHDRAKVIDLPSWPNRSRIN